MSKLQKVEFEQAEGKTKELLEMVQGKMGRVPNILKSMANSSAALEAYLNLSGALSNGKLTGVEREAIALAVSEKNECGYCTAAHTLMGSMQGLVGEQALESRKGKSSDNKLQALLKLALEVLDSKGNVSEATLTKAREVGYGDAEIAETIAHVALNIYTNYFNHINETELDFPEAPALS